MAKDEDPKRVIGSWREYLRESHESFRVFAWVWRDLTSPASKTWARRMLAAAFVGTVFSMAQAWLFKSIIDGVVSRRGELLLTGLAGFAACLLVSQLFNHFQMVSREHMMGEIFTHLDHQLSRLFFRKSLGQHLKDGNALSVGSLEKARNKIFGVEEMIMFSGLAAVLDLVLAFVFIWCLSWVAGLAMTALIVNYAVWAVMMNRRCLVECTPIEAEFRKLNRHRVERWDKVERVKTNGQEAAEVVAMTDWSRRTMAEDRRFWLWFIGMINWRCVIDRVVVVGIIAYGAWRAWQGDWTVGLLYPLFSWVRQLADNIWRIGSIEHQLNHAMPSVKAMMEALTAPADIVDRVDAVDLPADVMPRVEFCQVGHAYGDSCLESEDAPAPPADTPRRPVLASVSFTVEPGEKVALIGPSGAGKTTIMRLLQRYMDPERGSVTVNGRDLRDYRLASWVAALAYIAQQPQVLDGTIRSNLLYGLSPMERDRVKDDDLWAVMRRLQIDFGDRLNDGLNTKVGRNGIKLSGGESQRLMIGAAAMRQPRFMIIDEATSSLDSTTEKAVQAGLAEVLSGDIGALIIAHRLSTVRHLCTKFIVLKSSDDLVGDEPQVEAVAGSFEELYALSSTFRRLADDQDIPIAAVSSASPLPLFQESAAFGT